MFLVWTLSCMVGMGLAWGQVLSSCYEDAAGFCGRGKVAQVEDRFLPQKVPGSYISQGQQGAGQRLPGGKCRGAPALGAGTPMPLDSDVGASPQVKEDLRSRRCRRRCC